MVKLPTLPPKKDEVDLSHYNLEKIPKRLLQFSHLKSVNLAYNNIKKLPPQISNWTELEYLNITNNNIRYIPTTLWNLKNLTVLNVSSNTEINLYIPKGFYYQLKTLFIDKNGFELIIHSRNIGRKELQFKQMRNDITP